VHRRRRVNAPAKPLQENQRSFLRGVAASGGAEDPAVDLAA